MVRCLTLARCHVTAFLRHDPVFGLSVFQCVFSVRLHNSLVKAWGKSHTKTRMKEQWLLESCQFYTHITYRRRMLQVRNLILFFFFNSEWKKWEEDRIDGYISLGNITNPLDKEKHSPKNMETFYLGCLLTTPWCLPVKISKKKPKQPAWRCLKSH